MRISKTETKPHRSTAQLKLMTTVQGVTDHQTTYVSGLNVELDIVSQHKFGYVSGILAVVEKDLLHQVGAFDKSKVLLQ